MPIFIVGEKILNKKLECIINPIKANELFFHEGIEGKIMEKAGKKELSNLFDQENPFIICVPFVTDGLNAANKIIHFVSSEMSMDGDFKNRMFLGYDRIIRYAMELNVKTLVFPPVPYGYKRQGGMYSYKTAITLIKYFYNLYNPDYTIFILENNQGFLDHMNNYNHGYVSTSFPLSKRHKPLDYPFINDDYLDNYLKNNNYFKFNNYIKKRNYKIYDVDSSKKDILDLIKANYVDDASFCIKSNISKTNYINFFKNDYVFTKQEVIGLCMALHFDISKTKEFLERFNYTLDEEEEFDLQIIDFINNQEYDVFSINEKMYLNGLGQLGSVCSPALKMTKDTILLI